MLGDSPAMVQLRAQVDAAAASGASVLIHGVDTPSLGEVAQAIHYRRHREGESPLWSIDAAAALPSELQRLFDAVLCSEQPSTLLIESANRLQAEQQLQLLTAIGETQWNAQLIATHPNSARSIELEIGLSDELAAALSTLSITLPPLAERPEDIPTLVAWNIAELDRESEGLVSTIADDALDVMMIYPWPGEQDELAEVVSKAHVRARGRTISLGHLPKRLGHAVDKAALALDKPIPIALDDYLNRVEAALVERALELAAGNKAEAARLLGVSRPRLYRKLEQMGVVQSSPASKRPAPDRDSKPTAESREPASADPATPSEEGIEFLPVDGEE